MRMDDFYKIVDKNYHLFNENGIWLHFYGEPLTDPNFLTRVSYIKSKGAKTRISTNGSLLNEKRRHALATSGLDYIVVSISTLNRDTYKKTRGNDNLSLVLKNLLEFKKYIDDLKIPIQLQAVMIDTDNGSERDEFIKYFHDYGIHAAFHNFTNRANSIEMDLFVADKHDYSVKRGVCKELEKVGILSNCDVVTCCCDLEGQNSFGNLRDYDYSLEDLLKNGKLEEIKDRLINQIYIGACANCSDWIYYQEDSVEKYVTVYPAPQLK
jgi:MoaA/NifB/PqqE/SkfB family radical SAM enzyme